MEEEKLNPHDGYYSVQGYCPNCNHRIRIAVKVDFAAGRKKDIPQELIDGIKSLLPRKTIREIAAELKTSCSTVYTVAKRLGMVGLARNEALYAEIDKLLATTKNCDIAQRVGVSYGIVARRRVETGIKLDRDAVLDDKKEKIKKLHAEGFKDAEIARAMRLSRQRIEQIVKDIH